MESDTEDCAPQDCAGVIKGLCSLREEELFLDFTIEVEDKEFRVHKVVLASVSDYFKTMFRGSMVETKTDRVRLKRLDAQAVSDMIDYIYYGKSLSDADSSLEDLTECAAYLQIPGAIKDCIDCAKSKIEDDFMYVYEMLSLFKKFSLKDGVEYVSEVMRSDCHGVLGAWFPEDMSSDDVMNLIDIWQISEWDLFITIKEWVEIDIEKHQQYVSRFMDHIRFGLMTPEQLELIKGSDLYARSDGSWHKYVTTALEYHSLPTHQKVLGDTKQTMIRCEARPFQVAAGQLFDLNGGNRNERWRKRDIVEDINTGIDTFVVINNFLIACDLSNDRKWHIFDPRTMKWSSMATPETPRLDAALVSCNEHLYLLGGRPEGAGGATDTIETYDFQSNSWSMISSKLPVPVHKHGAVVMNNCIYVAGGVKADGEYSQRLDCLETSTETWHKKADPPKDENYKKLNIMQMDDEKVIFVMSKGTVHVQYYRPSKDDWIKWICEWDVNGGTKLSSGRYSSVLCTQNEFFLFNFNESTSDGNDSDNDSSDSDQDAVPYYVSAKWVKNSEGIINEWKLGESLPPILRLFLQALVGNIRNSKYMFLATREDPSLPVEIE